jgi:hypothetical protein
MFSRNTPIVISSFILVLIFKEGIGELVESIESKEQEASLSERHFLGEAVLMG